MRSKHYCLTGLMVVGVLVFGVWFAGMFRGDNFKLLSPMGLQIKELKPYEEFTLENLAQINYTPSKIETVGDKFYYTSQGKKVSGAINVPVGTPPREGYPVVVMLRGYVDKEVYTTGTGTKHAAEYFAGKGYVTLAPDFLGYGESEPEDENALGARIQRPLTVLELLASLSSLDNINPQQVFLWGHSNGGQIALSITEILGKREEKNIPNQFTVQGQVCGHRFQNRFHILFFTIRMKPMIKESG